jgi:hypothetical protein
MPSMILERFREILKLSDDERLQLYSELGATLFIDEPVTDPEIIADCERRYAEYLRDPSTGRPAGEVLAELRAKYIEKRE